MTKGSETQVPREASTGAQENVPNSDEYMERSKLNLLYSNYFPLGGSETFITKIHPEQANQVVRMAFKISIKGTSYCYDEARVLHFCGIGDEHLVYR